MIYNRGTNNRSRANGGMKDVTEIQVRYAVEQADQPDKIMTKC